jgi:hypothetical protein
LRGSQLGQKLLDLSVELPDALPNDPFVIDQIEGRPPIHAEGTSNAVASPFESLGITNARNTIGAIDRYRHCELVLAEEVVSVRFDLLCRRELSGVALERSPQLIRENDFETTRLVLLVDFLDLRIPILAWSSPMCGEHHQRDLTLGLDLSESWRRVEPVRRNERRTRFVDNGHLDELPCLAGLLELGDPLEA